MLINKIGVNEAMGRTTIEKGEEFGDVGKGRNGDRKGVGVGKSGCVEAYLLICTSGVNAALT